MSYVPFQCLSGRVGPLFACRVHFIHKHCQRNGWYGLLSYTNQYFPAGKAMSAWLAANRGDRQALCQELDTGADMEFKDPMGRTPLMEAAKHGHVACVQELLYRGADPTARSAVGWTAMDFCGSHESSHDEIHQHSKFGRKTSSSRRSNLSSSNKSISQ